MSATKTCPWCGSGDLECTKDKNGKWSINCNGCEMQGPKCRNIAEAQRSWNFIAGRCDEALVAEGLAEAAKPIVDELMKVGNQTDWRDGDETDRVYPWYEIEPLKNALDGYEQARAALAGGDNTKGE